MTFSYVRGNPDNLLGGTSAAMNDIQGPLYDIRDKLNEIDNKIAASTILPGAGRVFGGDSVESPPLTSASLPHTVNGKADGSKPMRLTVTPDIASWWPVNAGLIARPTAGDWVRLNAVIALTPGDAVQPSMSPALSILNNPVFGDSNSNVANALFALKAGISYTAELRILTLSGTWVYFRGGTSWTFIQSPGLLPR